MLPQVRMTVESDADRFEIRIADNGRGIAEQVRNTLFQPFVSFGKVNGTGIGLAIVHKIATDHGASVSVESTGPSGTVIRMSLPRNASSAIVAYPKAAVVQPQ